MNAVASVGIAMAYKLIDVAQARWRPIKAPHLVALVRAGGGVGVGGPSTPTRRRRDRVPTAIATLYPRSNKQRLEALAADQRLTASLRRAESWAGAHRGQ
jgi:hypothetical protein